MRWHTPRGRFAARFLRAGVEGYSDGIRICSQRARLCPIGQSVGSRQHQNHEEGYGILPKRIIGRGASCGGNTTSRPMETMHRTVGACGNGFGMLRRHRSAS